MFGEPNFDMKWTGLFSISRKVLAAVMMVMVAARISDMLVLCAKWLTIRTIWKMIKAKWKMMSLNHLHCLRSSSHIQTHAHKHTYYSFTHQNLCDIYVYALCCARCTLMLRGRFPNKRLNMSKKLLRNFMSLSIIFI